MENTTDSPRALSASDLFAPRWAVNVPESENDHTCTRCGHTVHLEHGTEWLGPDDNYHWNLCNACAQELVLEMWKKLESVANVVTTDHETKESFIGRVRAVLGANIPFGRVVCMEPAGHSLRDCTACQYDNDAQAALLRTKKLLRDCLSHLDDQFLAATCSDLHEQICDELAKGERTMNTTDEPEQDGTISLVGPWRRMSEAPKDGTFIKVLVYHPQRRYAKKKEKNEWAAVVEARWTDFNGGGWVWSGMFGRFQGWRPNASGQARAAQGVDDSTD